METRGLGRFIGGWLAQGTVCFFFGGAGPELNSLVPHVRAAEKQKTKKSRRFGGAINRPPLRGSADLRPRRLCGLGGDMVEVEG